MSSAMKLNIYSSVRQAYIHPSEILDVTFPEFIEIAVALGGEQTSKDSGPLYNFCEYNTTDFECPPQERFRQELTQWPRTSLIRRCRQNVVAIGCLLLDIDGDVTLDQAVTQWAPWEFFIYSTYNNSPTVDKFRLVVPLQQAVTSQQWSSRHTAMVEQFHVDPASFTLSQAFYMPTYHSGNRHLQYTYHNQSTQRYNVLDLPQEEPPVVERVHQWLAPEHISPRARIILNSLQTASNMHYPHALPVAILLKGLGYSYPDFSQLIRSIAAPDSQLLSRNVDLKHIWQEAYQCHMTDRKIAQLFKELGIKQWRFNS